MFNIIIIIIIIITEDCRLLGTKIATKSAHAQNFNSKFPPNFAHAPISSRFLCQATCNREAAKPGLDWSLDSGLDWTMDWTLDWTGLEEVWVQLLLAIDYFIRDREVLVLWLQHLGAV